MKIKMRSLTFIVILFCSFQLHAFENYLSNVFSPIPPGCVTNLPILQALNTSGMETLVAGNIEVTTIDAGSHDLYVTVRRIGCAVEGRSVIIIEFEGEFDSSGITECMFIPQMEAQMPSGAMKDLRLTDEPNSWFDFDMLGVVCEGNTRQFFLDTKTAFHGDYDQNRAMLVTEYNGDFTLRFKDILGEVHTADISAYGNDLGETSMSLNGRLSGNWGIAGAADQGFVISFGELASVTNMVFVSWYTYDNEGNQLWLVGNSTFELGDDAVQVQLEVVSGGDFLGSKRATRTAAGHLALTARTCNRFGMGYNLTNIGLGQGSVNLVRQFSMETAGYACADGLTRIMHENDF